MPACLAECSFYLRNKVAVDRPTESQVAALDSSAFPKAAPPGTSRASGVSKFFENIKPLSDFFGEILNAAGSLIARLFDSDKPIIECGISVAVREEVGSQSDEQDSALVESRSASEQHNEVLTSTVASPSSAQPKPSVLESVTSTSSSQVRDGQGRKLQEEWEGALFNGPSEDDLRNFEKLLTSSGHAQEYTSTWTYV